MVCIPNAVNKMSGLVDRELSEVPLHSYSMCSFNSAIIREYSLNTHYVTPNRWVQVPSGKDFFFLPF